MKFSSFNKGEKAVSEKTIRRNLNIIKDYFPDSFELIRAGKGEKGCYKAITNKAFENFINPELLSLMVQTFNLANKSDLFNNFDLDDNDKKILESKIKNTNKLYEFKNKPFEKKKDDFVIFNKLESSIKHQKYINIEYEVKDKIEKYEVKPYKFFFINENFYLACEIEHGVVTCKTANFFSIFVFSFHFLINTIQESLFFHPYQHLKWYKQLLKHIYHHL